MTDEANRSGEESRDLVAQLRLSADAAGAAGADDRCRWYTLAADEIERLRARVAELEGRLKTIRQDFDVVTEHSERDALGAMASLRVLRKLEEP